MGAVFSNTNSEVEESSQQEQPLDNIQNIESTSPLEWDMIQDLHETDEEETPEEEAPEEEDKTSEEYEIEYDYYELLLSDEEDDLLLDPDYLPPKSLEIPLDKLQVITRSMLQQTKDNCYQLSSSCNQDELILESVEDNYNFLNTLNQIMNESEGPYCYEIPSLVEYKSESSDENELFTEDSSSSDDDSDSSFEEEPNPIGLPLSKKHEIYFLTSAYCIVIGILCYYF